MKRLFTFTAMLATLAGAGCGAGGSSKSAACAHAWRDAVTWTQNYTAGLPSAPSARLTYQLEVAKFQTLKSSSACTIPAP